LFFAWFRYTLTPRLSAIMKKNKTPKTRPIHKILRETCADISKVCPHRSCAGPVPQPHCFSSASGECRGEKRLNRCPSALQLPAVPMVVLQLQEKHAMMPAAALLPLPLLEASRMMMKETYQPRCKKTRPRASPNHSSSGSSTQYSRYHYVFRSRRPCSLPLSTPPCGIR